MADPPNILFNRQPWDTSTSLPLVHPFPSLLSLGNKSIINRTVNELVANGLNILVNYKLYPQSRYKRSIRGLKAWNSLHDDCIIGEGPPGIREKKQEA